MTRVRLRTMRVLVLVQFATRHKTLAADLAAIRSLSGVNAFVDVELIFPSEPLPTRLADELPLPVGQAGAGVGT